MTAGEIFALGFALIMLNLFALIGTDEEYLAASFRRRHDFLYMILGNPEEIRRADGAAAKAERVARWSRPLVLILANGFWLGLLLRSLNPR